MDSGREWNNPHPRAAANPLSAATFTWMLGTFWKGFKKNLEIEDLYNPLDEHSSQALGDTLQKNWSAEVAKKKGKKSKPSFYRALAKTFQAKCFFYGIIFGVLDTFSRIGQPIFLSQLIAYFNPDNKMSLQIAYLYATLVILCSGLMSLINHPFIMATFHLGMKIRIACCSLIYRKSLRLSQSSLGNTTVGQIVNMMSNDVNNFDYLMGFIHDLWIGPLQTAIVAYFIWTDVGFSALIGLLALILIIPIQGLMGKLTSIFRMKMAGRTDERVRLMNEIITGIQVIKMYTWEKPFEKLVSMARKKEITQIRNSSFITAVYVSFTIFTSRIAIFSTFLAYSLFGNAITAQKVFMVSSFYNSLSRVMTIGFPEAIAQIAKTSVSIKRIEKFLLYEEIPLDNSEDKAFKGVQFSEVMAKWSQASSDYALFNINLNIKPGMLVAVIGPVGSGKSSLLQAILQELPLTSGTLNVGGKVTYSSQEPWVFSGSVRHNITFIDEYESAHYNTVAEVCALKHDFEQFPFGDATLVGERGITLSGGQKARINLARAVYHEADVYLLDDPLSAVDTHVGQQLFTECISGYLSSKIRILITHQLQYLKAADIIVILNKGRIESIGNFDELKSSGVDFAQWLAQKSKENAEDEEIHNFKKSKKYASASEESLILANDEQMKDALQKQKVDEEQSIGMVNKALFKKYLSAGGGCCISVFLFIMFILAQLLGSACDYWITFWVNIEEMRASSCNQNISTVCYLREPFNFYEYTLKSISQPFLGYGTSNNSIIQVFSRDICINVYIGLISTMVIVVFFRSFLFFAVCMKASSTLHNKMFASLTRAKMRFFDTNPSGRVLNRFSKDMGAIDEVLPHTLLDSVQIGLMLLAVIILVSVMNYWLILPAIAVVALSYFFRIIYLATTSSLKRLEGITRSPVFTHLNASLQGLTSIRAFKAQKVLEKQFDNHQDLHSSAFYLLLAAGRAFGYWLDFLCFIYTALVSYSFLVLGSDTFGANAGLAITQSIGLTGMFQWGMKQLAQLEMQMTSVERVYEYINLDKEPCHEIKPGQVIPNEWPSEGQITFYNVSLKYDPLGPTVLNNLNFVIHSKEKVGVVGRTGAGKSSLIASLFRLADIIEGTIFIDDIDCAKIKLQELRSKIAIIPQQPVIFSGTLRKNLDPFDEYSDHILWIALEQVELKDLVNNLPATLNSRITEGGTNFSVGQRQLLCLARAIIRNTKILILDEATANVDPQTDAAIQKTIRENFYNCTVLTIAHRLHTVMDSDRIIVMDHGTIVELGKPYDLLKRKDGALYSMVEQTGHAMAKDLHKIAEKEYLREKTLQLKE